MTNTLYTFGLHDRSLDDVLMLLASTEIHTLVDIRLQPDVAHAAQFATDVLRDALVAVGREYHWAGRQLGNGRTVAPNSPHTALPDTTLRGYADYMGSMVFKKAATQLVHLAGLAPTAIVCEQRDALNCYRSLIADYLTLQGLNIVHLIDSTPGHAHLLRPEVRRESAELIYDRDITNTKN